MKKQILFLTFLVLATVASVSNSYGQATAGSTPRPLTSCDLDDPLQPVAGRPYTYQAVINPAGGTAYWYATNSTTFTNGGARVATELIAGAGGTDILSATNYMTSLTSATSPTSTTITWSSAGLEGINATTNPLFVVVEYEGPTCSNNLKVMQILPQNAFTVDILNLDAADQSALTYDVTEEQCYSDVAGATFVNGEIDYDFGINYLYYEVVAANFTSDYDLQFQIDGLITNQTASIDWGYTKGTYDNSLGTVTNTTPTAATTITTNETNTAAGVSIYVRVTVNNNDYEGLANQQITLAVDAVDSADLPDVLHTDCSVNTAFADIATQQLNARPTVTPGTPMLPAVAP